ncbi:MAG: pilus assembly protein PilM [Acidobacteria bacterium]|nr:pilus assembly protein PilM [Acidobacteriota bacterium]
MVVGIANAKAVVRAAEVPDLPANELRSALPFHVSDLVPWPIDDTQLDFIVTGRPDDGGERLRVLLVAAQREMLRPLLAALDGAGLRPRRIDLVPLALIDSLTSPAAGPGQREAIVELGVGVTNIVVHHDGVARFARTMFSSGAPVAERLGRERVAAAAGPMGWHIQGDIVPAVPVVDPVIGEIVDSLDFHLAQPGSAPIERVVVIGGSADVADIRAGIAEHGNVEVVERDPLAQVDLGRTRQAFESMGAAASRYAPALGLALAERRTATRRVNLVPPEVAERRAHRRQLVAAVAIVVALVVSLAGLSVERRRQVGNARAEAATVERQVRSLETQVATLDAVADEQADLARRQGLLQASLAGDVAWTRFVRQLSGWLPPDVWLSSFSAARGSGITLGTVTITAKGADQASPARFLRNMAGFGSVSGAWISSSTRDAGPPGLVTFNATANLTAQAESGRATTVGTAP